MTHRITTPVDALAAPKRDGDILVSPQRGDIASIIQSNRTLLNCCNVGVAGRPIREWRNETLKDELRILSGHQPAFFHAGVWAKSAAAAHWARQAGGQAAFLVVDSDLAHGAELAWPVVRDGYCSMGRAVGAQASKGQAFEQLTNNSVETWGRFWKQLPEEARGSPLLGQFESAFLAGKDGDYVSRWSHALSVVERSMGISEIRYLRISDVFSSSSGAQAIGPAFVADILANAERFAAAYNESLKAYRSRRRIRGADHPMPDLTVDVDRVETPFWLLTDSLPRRRMFVSRRSPDQLSIFADREEVGTLNSRALHTDAASAQHGSLSGWRIRPRALATTLIARLFLCDLFIHGIGGAKYDQITDDIIRRYYGMEPPAYACVTATLQLPLPRHGLDRETNGDLRRKIRDVRFNPQRFPDHLESPDSLIRREAAIAEALRLRLHHPHARAERKSAFLQIQSANAAALRDAPSLSNIFRQELSAVQAKAVSDRVAESREWFWCMHSPHRLQELIEKVSSNTKPRP